MNIFFKTIISEIKDISVPLYKILIPFVFVVKILEEIGFIKFVSTYFEPIVQLMGLPAEMGFIWVTAIIVNVYAAIIVFINIVPGLDLTVAQVTIITTVILIAHNIFVESAITRSAGISFFYAAFLRISIGFLAGLILHKLYSSFGFLEEKYSLIFEQPKLILTYTEWFYGQIKNLAFIFLIICILVLTLNIFKKIGIEHLIRLMLKVPLRFMGIGEQAINVVIVGLTIGIQFGGGLLIKEAKSKEIDKQSILLSLSFLNLVHAIIEDTILMSIMGGHLSGILFFRLIFSLLIVFIILFLYKNFEGLFQKFIFVRA
ncbi:MAG: nucleoside recognition protein [Candidatus Fonsibacter sp.]